MGILRKAIGWSSSLWCAYYLFMSVFKALNWGEIGNIFFIVAFSAFLAHGLVSAIMPSRKSARYVEKDYER